MGLVPTTAAPTGNDSRAPRRPGRSIPARTPFPRPPLLRDNAKWNSLWRDGNRCHHLQTARPDRASTNHTQPLGLFSIGQPQTRAVSRHEHERICGSASRGCSMRGVGDRHRTNFLIFHQPKCSSSFRRVPNTDVIWPPGRAPPQRQWQPIAPSAGRRPVLRHRTLLAPKLLLLSSP